MEGKAMTFKALVMDGYSTTQMELHHYDNSRTEHAYRIIDGDIDHLCKDHSESQDTWAVQMYRFIGKNQQGLPVYKPVR